MKKKRHALFSERALIFHSCHFYELFVPEGRSPISFFITFRHLVQTISHLVYTAWHCKYISVQSTALKNQLNQIKVTLFDKNPVFTHLMLEIGDTPIQLVFKLCSICSLEYISRFLVTHSKEGASNIINFSSKHGSVTKISVMPFLDLFAKKADLFSYFSNNIPSYKI